MSTTYKAKIYGRIVPTEDTTLADGTESVKTINSNLDQTFNAYIEKTLGTSVLNYRVADATLTTTARNLDYIFHNQVTPSDPYWTSASCNFLFIQITGGTGTPTCEMFFAQGGDPTAPHPSGIKLSGVGDFMLMSFDDLDLTNLDAETGDFLPRLYCGSGEDTEIKIILGGTWVEGA